MPAPISVACSTSRTKPAMRDSKVRLPIVAVARSKFIEVGMAGYSTKRKASRGS